MEGADTWTLRKSEQKYDTYEVLKRGAEGGGQLDSVKNEDVVQSHEGKERPAYNTTKVTHTVFTKNQEFLTRIPPAHALSLDALLITVPSPPTPLQSRQHALTPLRITGHRTLITDGHLQVTLSVAATICYE